MNKRITAAVLAALTLTAPFATTAAYADSPSRNDHVGRNDNRGNDNHRGDNQRQNNRQDQRWDATRDNGYTYNGRWNYGPPPSAYVGRAGFQPGYQAWRRGDQLPSFYRTQFRTVDFRREHLRAPPRGYHYVRGNRGDVLLVGIATGVILSVILAGR